MASRAWAATRKGLFELERGGKAWRIRRVSFLGEPVSMLLPPGSDGRMFAALNLGHFGCKVHASDDAGVTWNEVATPAYPEQPDGAPGPAWKLVLIWSLARSPDGGLWAGTLPGGLFRSADGGASWQLNESLWNLPARLDWFGGGYDVPGIHSILPHPSNGREMLVGISCGGVWKTEDGGASWTPQTKGMKAGYMPPEQAENPNTQDPHLVAQCAAHPQSMWCQHHTGMWRSTDRADSWRGLEAVPVSDFGFAVAAHPSDADTAWFAPAVKDEKRVPVDGALVVNRTRDGGKSFETLRGGLPQQHCYDLVYRHGLVVDETGRSLLMGSTTGNLWASDDAGDSWINVSTQLPPIHALRFG
jgi:hypothetical protein